MHIDVSFTARNVNAGVARDRSAVIIDVLRASTTIAYALSVGAASVYPVLEVDEARRFHRDWVEQGVDAVLAGERQALMPPGFDLGNSPTEVCRARLSGRRLVLTTSNGTRAALATNEAAYRFAGSFVNLAAVCRVLVGVGRDVLLVCAGTDLGTSFCLEDGIAAGFMVRELNSLLPEPPELSDSALLMLRASHDLASNNQTVRTLLDRSHHGQRLAGLGLDDDLDRCADINSVDIVPVLTGAGFCPWPVKARP